MRPVDFLADRGLSRRLPQIVTINAAEVRSPKAMVGDLTPAPEGLAGSGAETPGWPIFSLAEIAAMSRAGSPFRVTLLEQRVRHHPDPVGVGEMPPLDLLRRSSAGVRARAVADLGGRAPDGARAAPASDTTTAPDRGAGIFGRTSPSPASGPAPPSSAHPRATVSWNASSEPSRNSSAGSANSNPSGNATTPSGDGASSITKAGWSGNTDTGPPLQVRRDLVLRPAGA